MWASAGSAACTQGITACLFVSSRPSLPPSVSFTAAEMSCVDRLQRCLLTGGAWWPHVCCCHGSTIPELHIPEQAMLPEQQLTLLSLHVKYTSDR